MCHVNDVSIGLFFGPSILKSPNNRSGFLYVTLLAEIQLHK